METHIETDTEIGIGIERDRDRDRGRNGKGAFLSTKGDTLSICYFTM